MAVFPKRETWQVCAGFYSPADGEYSWAVWDECQSKPEAQAAFDEHIATAFTQEELVGAFKKRSIREAEYARRSNTPLLLLRVISQVSYHLPVSAHEMEDA